jgi:hypothetical protein
MIGRCVLLLVAASAICAEARLLETSGALTSQPANPPAFASHVQLVRLASVASATSVSHMVIPYCALSNL